MTEAKVFNFNYKWSFRLADAFPLKKALEATRDAAGRFFYERDYEEEGWEEVGLPHTFNDGDLFADRIQDAGSGQKHTFACYRKWFTLPEGASFGKVLLESEGVRQTCYLYVNGRLAGYLESGVAPFGMDLTPYLLEGERNLIAIATDNTSTRNLDLYSAETPNHPDAEPGAFMDSLTVPERIPEGQRGVGYFWNCNDFNPSVGGLTRNIRLYCKPKKVYLTLPLYSNLKTHGTYIYAENMDIAGKCAEICAEAEIRNETGTAQEMRIEVEVEDMEGKLLAAFASETADVSPAGEEALRPMLSILPKDAYRRTETGFEPVPEDEAAPTEYEAVQTTVLSARCAVSGLRFWSLEDPALYRVRVKLYSGGEQADQLEIVTGFRAVEYRPPEGLFLNGKRVWLTGYAQRASNEWAAIGTAVDWLKDEDARWIRESNANHIRFMHVAGSPADIRSFDRLGIVCTQPAGDKERENFGRQWDQRVELMRDVILYFRNSPSVWFWEAGNNSINREHMREMRLLKERLDPKGGRFMGCRTINTEEVIAEAEYVGTMLNRHAASFIASQVPVTETEYLREESPRRVWDDYSPPDYDYDNRWLGKMGRKQPGGDCYDLTAEDFALCAAKGYAEFFHDRMGGASGKNYYSAAAALCWTDSAQHGRQAYSENARMSGRVDAVRIPKQSYYVFQTLQSPVPQLYILGHWNYPKEGNGAYRYALKEFRDGAYEKTGEYAFRDPHNKTVYVIGSYAVAKVELRINGRLAGRCDRPQDGFVFAFPGIDVTQSGEVRAYGYGYGGELLAEDVRQTAGEPAALRLSLHTGERGFVADGVDIAYVDISVVDGEGRLCPLADNRITFRLEGEAVFLGGYNSGRFRGYGRDDSVIHEDHVYAECGQNRVFLRSTAHAGEIVLYADMETKDGAGQGEDRSDGIAKRPDGTAERPDGTAERPDGTAERPDGTAERPDGTAERGVIRSEIAFSSVAGETEALTERMPQRAADRKRTWPVLQEYAFEANPEADAAKYTPSDTLTCKVLVNGQEPGTNGILSVVDQGSIYSPILFILESMHNSRPEAFSYDFDGKALTITSGGHVVKAEVGRTHLLVDGEENLLNGQPYLNGDGVLIVEINAVITWIEGVTARYDDKVNVYRISW